MHDTTRFTFPHERLDAYHVALELAKMACRMASRIPRGHRKLADQLQRSGTAPVCLIAEGAPSMTRRAGREAPALQRSGGRGRRGGGGRPARGAAGAVSGRRAGLPAAAGAGGLEAGAAWKQVPWKQVPPDPQLLSSPFRIHRDPVRVTRVLAPTPWIRATLSYAPVTSAWSSATACFTAPNPPQFHPLRIGWHLYQGGTDGVSADCLP